MLIQALCQYYDVLKEKGKPVAPLGYSKEDVKYLICLKPDGSLDEIVDFGYTTKKQKNGEDKVIQNSKTIILPYRLSTTATSAETIEHRPKYIFGLEAKNVTSNNVTFVVLKNAHEDFIEKNMAFIEGLDSPVINAYRKFMETWDPHKEIENPQLLKLGKQYNSAKFAFCLSGEPERMLHDDPIIRKKWNEIPLENITGDDYFAQCSVTGKIAPVARLHGNIKNIVKADDTGAKLSSYNNTAEESYGEKQSINSKISVEAMHKYVNAFNYLTEYSEQDSHRVAVGNYTIVFWSLEEEKNEVDYRAAIYNAKKEKQKYKTDGIDKLFRESFLQASDGIISKTKMKAILGITQNIEYYIAGFEMSGKKRMALRFLYKRKAADILFSIAKFQNDMRIINGFPLISMENIKNELLPPENKESENDNKNPNDKLNSAIIAKLFDAVINERQYPIELMVQILRRIRTDSDIEVNATRIGILKACLNRNFYKKEEIKVAIDRKREDPGYLCGRLFAVLEKLQKEALEGPIDGKINRTIREKYFASASTTPAIVFPKLLSLAQHHIEKTDRPEFYQNTIAEIMNKLNEYPQTLDIKGQGNFGIGYYHQYQNSEWRDSDGYAKYMEKKKETENQNNKRKESEED